MTIELIESFGHWSGTAKGGERKWVADGKDGTPYFHSGTGALDATNIEILPNGGPTGQPISGRTRPAPGSIRFRGLQQAGKGAVLASDLPSALTEYRVGFNLMLESFDLNFTDFHDRIVWMWSSVPDVGITIDIEFLGADDEQDRCHLNIVQGNNDSGNANLYDGKSESSTVGAGEDGTFDYHALFLNTWYYIELYVEIGNGDGSMELRVDGETWFQSFGNLDTQPNAAVNLNEIWVASGMNFPISSEAGSGLRYQITDLHVIDASTTPNDGFIFPAVLQILTPTAESGTDIDFTPSTGTDNSALVDEDQQNFDSDYNESNTATDKDRFTTSDTLQDGGFGDIIAVQVQAVARDTLDTGTRTARVVIHENATEGVGATQTLTASGYQTINDVFEVNPDTSAAWTQAEIEAAEFGYEIVS